MKIMEHEEPRRSGFFSFTARVLNEAGGAIVDLYDLSSKGVGMASSTLKKAPVLPEKVKDMLTRSRGIVKPVETKRIKAKIKKKEKKIDELYSEIGKEGAKHLDSDAEKPLETEAVKSLISDVREYEKDIQRLQTRITELEEEKKEPPRKKTPPKERKRAKEKDVPAAVAVRLAIKNASRQGMFESGSDRAMFEKAANDLLDKDVEVKILAVTELAKMKNKAAVPILIEAVKFDDPYLASETINALINIGDSRAISLFKEKAKDSHYRVRVACLRGLYKLAEDDDVAPFLADALKDEHPDVRKTAVTFIGWKENIDTVPGIVQCLRDEDDRVSKAAVAALANMRDEAAVLPLIRTLENKNLDIKKKALEAIKTIIGEEVAFDFQASGEALTEAVDNLMDWWQKKRLGEVEIAQSEEGGEGSEPEEPDEEVVEPEQEAEKNEPEEEALTEENLSKKLKSELIAICTGLGIECDESLKKTEIIQLILGKDLKAES